MRFLSLSRRNFKEIFRDPLTSLLGVGLPVMLLLLFTSIYQRKPEIEIFAPASLTPGIIIFSFSFIMMFSATLLAKDRQSAFLMRMLSTPLKPADFIMAYFLPFFILGLILIGFCMLCGFFLGANFANVLGILLILILIGISCIGLGLIIGSLLTVNQVSGVGSIVITAVSLFGNIWTPLEFMGGIFIKIGYAMPFAHASDATRVMVRGGSLSDVIPDFLWVLVYAIVLLILGVMAFAWRTRPR